MPLFYLPVSRVFPAYHHYYNIWHPRGDTGYLDTEITYLPFNAEWAVFHEILFSALDRVGLKHLSEDEKYEPVPFVSFLDFDDDNDDIDDEGHLVPANVIQCLFGWP